MFFLYGNYYNSLLNSILIWRVNCKPVLILWPCANWCGSVVARKLARNAQLGLLYCLPTHKYYIYDDWWRAKHKIIEGSKSVITISWPVWRIEFRPFAPSYCIRVGWFEKQDWVICILNIEMYSTPNSSVRWKFHFYF